MVTNNKLITQIELKQILKYDQNTGVFIWIIDCGPGRPNAHDTAGRVQVKHSGKSYRDISVNSKRYYAHRLAYLYMIGTWPDEVDHINGDGTDNRWCNLREVDRMTNCHNMRKSVSNSSGLVGVHWHNHGNKWQVYINENKTRHNLGLFSDFFEAVCARKSAEVSHGFHANHGQVRVL